MQISPAGCSWKQFVNLAGKCGFIIFEGGSHTKIKTTLGRFITTIPRHNVIDKDTAKGILKKYRIFGCQF